VVECELLADLFEHAFFRHLSLQLIQSGELSVDLGFEEKQFFITHFLYGQILKHYQLVMVNIFLGDIAKPIRKRLN